MPQILEFPAPQPIYSESRSTCDDGVRLAQEVLDSCVIAMVSGNSPNLMARFDSYVRHRAECEKCNEV